MLSAGHQPLVDDLRSIVPAGIDMYTFFDHAVGASAERLAGLIATWLYLGLWLLALGGHDGGRTEGSRVGKRVLWSIGTRQGSHRYRELCQTLFQTIIMVVEMEVLNCLAWIAQPRLSPCRVSNGTPDLIQVGSDRVLHVKMLAAAMSQ